jgi:hypothetical protein
MRRDLKTIGSGAILALSLAACGSQATGASDEAAASADPSAPEVDLAPSPTNGPSSAARANKIPLGEEGAWTGNIVPDGGRVLVDFGPMHQVLSADPMKHVYLRGKPGISADRVFLAASVLDTKLGITFDFELDYNGETGPIDLVQHGHLSLIDRGPPQRATAGQVTVSRAGAGRLSLKFSELELGTPDATGTVLSSEPLADGLVIGDVERVCRIGAAPDADNPFCAAQD